MNHVGMIGRMTKDPAIRKLSEGRVNASFVLAVNRAYKTKNGEDADFVLCTVWGKLAENVSKYCGKGSLVGVTGRIQSRAYAKEDGTRMFVTEVVAEQVQFISTKPPTDERKESRNESVTQAPERQDPVPTPGGDFVFMDAARAQTASSSVTA